MENASARNMWGDYLDDHLEHAFVKAPEVVHFYDNKEDADQCAQMIRAGSKKAVSRSLLGLQYRNEPLPQLGAFNVITNWEGEALCIIKTTAVRLKPFFSIDEQYTVLEGNALSSLDSWKKYHWDYFTRELAVYGRVPRESTIVVCMEFEKVF